MASPTVVIPVVLCGGVGTRLWPLSRSAYPKQFLSLVGNRTMLQETVLRLAGLAGLQPPLLVCNNAHRFIAAEQMRAVNVEPAAVLLEPVGRNTAPAVAVASLQAMAAGQDDALLLVLAADHVIADAAAFRATINQAIPAALGGRLVTFGVTPTAPETGYGYIEADPRSDGFGLHPVRRFVEKPSREKAQAFLTHGSFCWNSGIFLFRASVMAKELERCAPDVLHAVRLSLQQAHTDLDFLRLEPEAFRRCPAISIDVAVMEHTRLGSVAPMTAGWSDVGNWSTLWQQGDHDEQGNTVCGRVLHEDVRNSYLRSEHRLVVGLGLEDLVVVETNDAVLVARRDQTRSVKQVVERLQAAGARETQANQRTHRPWGYYDTGVDGERWQVKKIHVKPGCSLSLQMHHHRAEHWVVVEGTACVERDGDTLLLSENQSAYIPLGCRHRLSNPGRIPLELIEVQSGSYLGEDDIVRFEDHYGRHTSS
ncbi:mannose-1-phosphate guanylyltransferase/mannose-6-phosphate isomerase [Candidatus Synechococcus spongiarum LMB bulk15M]|uniref:mannose-1-phosphate guanylyltransferase n=1 Tax=Candidatus Synechococcus spongiarum LMB bulk15M TaxID=1943582 RepID=A0A1T1CNV4_9SYNE|nr:mannose-1-phosphate guanylyltransferase/mannose-6-phosphate isomerase [Candidatus Synechococcus spongiarum LMB bulk15M]